MIRFDSPRGRYTLCGEPAPREEPSEPVEDELLDRCLRDLLDRPLVRPDDRDFDPDRDRLILFRDIFESSRPFLGVLLMTPVLG